MEIAITSKSFKVTESLRNAIEVELERLSAWKVAFINPHVILNKNPADEFTVEVKIAIPHGELFAKTADKDIYNSITDAFRKVESQLNKRNDKQQQQQYQ